MDTSTQIQTVQIESLSTFVDTVASTYAGNYDVLFRGQRAESWRLTPKLGRVNFRLRYSGSIEQTEKKMLDDFERLSVPFIGDRIVQDDWDRIALAQHHGLPTRLLDWTSNPLVALWFAVAKPSNLDEGAVVWAFDADVNDYVDHTMRPLDVPRTMVFRPRHHDSRIVAQSGWFTVHKYSQSTERFSNFDGVKLQRPRLRKFCVPKQYFAAIRDDLGRCGINSATLFPDLAGLCEALTWKYEHLADEARYDVANSL